MLLDLSGAISALLTGDWSKAAENMKKFFADFRRGVVEIIYGKESAEELKDIEERYKAGKIDKIQKRNEIEAIPNKKFQNDIKEQQRKNTMKVLGLKNDDDWNRFVKIENYVKTVRDNDSYQMLLKTGNTETSDVYVSELPADMQQFIQTHEKAPMHIQYLKRGSPHRGCLKRASVFNKIN